ncbi:Crp/Fnr family transcriptional regulator [Flavobacteriaceae bacterium XHP0103]|uniref:Crp/Fnr family transcriptional regulator n=1 Tax=Marixanthotalea marina TaxID=2844359 RepID=UPI002989E86C|nr:Crp/Fnr family transcriptional regulator [Marixanthotalea marina]MBU3821596.1 Crp/Fnr family transcriptional regulator [Marixanthotalea marina]
MNKMMYGNILKNHIDKFTAVGDEEYDEIIKYFNPIHIKKKENLLTAGDVCKTHYFVVKGCLRKFFINEKGIEQTTEFAIENWWMCDNFSFLSQTESQFNIQAVEKSQLLAISKSNYEKLLDEHPTMEKYFRCIYQKAYAALQMRAKFVYEFSREDHYHHFSSSFPEFIQRIPQYLLASYLNFTPEYLSKIRKKDVS